MSAPFRISRKALRPVAAGRPTYELDEYLSRLIKLIPTEVISLYIVGKGIIENEQILLLLWTIACLFFVVLIRFYGTADIQKNLPPQLKAILISTISYVVWIYSMGDIFALLGVYSSKLGSLLVLLWTAIVPYVYKGDLEA